PVAWDDAADGVLVTDERAVRRRLCGKRGERLRAGRPRGPDCEQGTRRRRGREGGLARGRRYVQRPRPPPLDGLVPGTLRVSYASPWRFREPTTVMKLPRSFPALCHSGELAPAPGWLSPVLPGSRPEDARPPHPAPGVFASPSSLHRAICTQDVSFWPQVR